MGCSDKSWAEHRRLISSRQTNPDYTELFCRVSLHPWEEAAVTGPRPSSPHLLISPILIGALIATFISCCVFFGSVGICLMIYRPTSDASYIDCNVAAVAKEPFEALWNLPTPLVSPQHIPQPYFSHVIPAWTLFSFLWKPREIRS